MTKEVRIPLKLFLRLYVFFVNGDESEREIIREAIDKKMDSVMKRFFYTRNKTAETDAEREEARKEYLDMAGIHEDFRY